MANDGKVIIDIEADSKGFDEELDDVSKKAKDGADGLEDLGKGAEKAEKGLDAADIAAGTLVANGLSTLIGAAKDAVMSIVELADSTREYREDMAKLETAFSSAGHSTETASKAYEDMYAILGESDRSVEAVNHLAELTKNEQEVAKWSTIAAGVTAKFGDSLPIEGLTEAANETAKVGKVTGPLADALTWAGISEDEFNKKLEKCNSEQERATLITETLNKEYEAAAAEYNELTASTQEARRATSEMEAAQAELGAAIEPVTTAWTRMKAQALTWLVDTGIPALKTGFGWVKDNLPLVATVVGGLTAAFVAFKVAQLASTAATHGMTIAQYAAAAAQALLNTTMLANPISLIIIAITALVAAFIYLWNNCEGFREFWINLWETIKNAFTVAWEAIVTFFTVTIPETFNNFVAWLGELGASIVQFFVDMWASIVSFFTEGIPSFLEKVKEWFADLPYKLGYLVGQLIGHIIQFGIDLWNFATTTVPEFIAKVIEFFATLPGKIWEWLKNAIQKVGEWGKNLVTTGKEKAKEFITNVIDFVKQLPEKIATWLTNALTNVITWGANLATKGKEAALSLYENIVTIIKELPGKMLTLGQNIVEGLWNGISNMASWIGEKIKSFGDGVLSGIKDFFGIASPSKLMRDVVGENIALGVGVGIEGGLPDVEKQLTKDLNGLTGRVQASVNAGSARAGMSMGRQETGFADLARAVGIQTAGISSLSAQYRRGTGNMRPVVLELNGRELGRAMVNVGGAEETRTGLKLSMGGAY